MKNLLITLLAFFSIQTLMAASTENQRKYVFPSQNDVILNNYQSQKGLSFVKHSFYQYFDIYLDTPQHTLLKNKLSLRFRKRVRAEGISYDFQLKSEMTRSNSIRIEVEEDDITFYKVKTDKGWVPLPIILEEFFELASNGIVTQEDLKQKQKELKYLSSWFQMKAHAAISPFQKLNRMLGSRSYEIIKNLRPTLIGQSNRTRYHILGKEGHGYENEIENLNLKHSHLPEYFVNNPNHIWLMEGSKDHATFHYLLDDHPFKHTINEFEVENKYLSESPVIIDRLMIGITNSLNKSFHAKAEYASKYRQSVMAYFHRE